MDHPVGRVGPGNYTILVPIANTFEGFEFSIWDGNLLIYETRSVSSTMPHCARVAAGRFTLKVLSGSVSGCFTLETGNTSPDVIPGDFSIKISDPSQSMALDLYTQYSVNILDQHIVSGVSRVVYPMAVDFIETPFGDILSCRFFIVSTASSYFEGFMIEHYVHGAWLELGRVYATLPFGYLMVSIVSKKAAGFRLSSINDLAVPPLFYIGNGSLLYTRS